MSFHYKRTKSGAHFTWIIEQFTTPELFGPKIISPFMTIDNDMPLNWRLVIYPNGFNDDAFEYVSVFLELEETSKLDVEIDVLCELQLESSNNGPYIANLCTIFGDTRAYGLNYFIRKSTLFKHSNGLLHRSSNGCDFGDLILNGNLTITPIANTSVKCTHNLVNDLNSTFENPKYTDVIFNVDGREIKAHKFILASRNEVFAAMFEHNMTETLTNRIEINDIDYNIFRELLRFIYTGKIMSLKKYAFGLFAAANKYCINDLKTKSMEIICNNITPTTAIEILLLGDLYDCSRMKKAAIDSINQNALDLINTPMWTDVINKPALFNEIYKTIIEEHAKCSDYTYKRKNPKCIY